MPTLCGRCSESFQPLEAAPSAVISRKWADSAILSDLLYLVESLTSEQRLSPEEIRREIEMIEKQIEQLSTEKVREESDCLMISH